MTRLRGVVASRLGQPFAPEQPPGARSALVGIAIVLAAAIFRLALTPWLGNDLAFLTFYPAVAVAAWAGGLTGGLVALGASAVLADLLLLEPAGSLAVGDWVGLAVFIGSGVLISALGGQLHGSRVAAERGRRRAALLADASAALVERVDRVGAVESVAHLLVTRFADWCAIDLLDADQRVAETRVAAADERLVTLTRELRGAEPPEPGSAGGIAAVARTGVPEYVLDVPDDRPGLVGDPLLRRLAAEARLRSYIAVPLAVPDKRWIGVLTVAMFGSGRRFDDEDVDTMRDLGRRVGVAVDHATLFAEVEAQRDELDAVIRVMGDPVLVARSDGSIRSRNAAADAVLGRGSGERLDDVLAALQPVDGRPDTRHVPATGRFVVPIVFDVEARSAPARIAVLRDVTALLDSEAARDAFIGMLSHELRTPITTIYGTAQVLRRPLDPEASRELVDDLAAETDRLYRLVEDLLVLSRFERGRLEVASEPVLVHRVVQAALARTTAQHRALRVEVDAPPGLPPALADATYLEQIIRNLASNAVKYAGETARIQVRISAEDTGLRIEFEDDGPGIAEHDAERVFALYERVGAHGPVPGAGVGLFVCRRLVEAMGGAISVRRGEGGGACFALTLPGVEEVPAPRPAATT